MVAIITRCLREAAATKARRCYWPSPWLRNELHQGAAAPMATTASAATPSTRDIRLRSRSTSCSCDGLSISPLPSLRAHSLLPHSFLHVFRFTASALIQPLTPTFSNRRTHLLVAYVTRTYNPVELNSSAAPNPESLHFSRLCPSSSSSRPLISSTKMPSRILNLGVRASQVRQRLPPPPPPI